MNYDQACIPAQHQRVEWAALGHDGPIEAVHRWADEYPDAWLNTEAAKPERIGRGLLLYGSAGTGKTTAASLALRKVIDHRHNGWFIPAPSLEQLLHDRMDLSSLLRKVDMVEPEAQVRFEAITERMTKARRNYYVVVIDDWGRERSASAFLQDFIEGLVRERYNRGLPTIITTNLDVDGIEERYGVQWLSFVRQAFVMVDFGKRDHRRAAG